MPPVLSARLKRITRELDEIKRDTLSSVEVTPVHDGDLSTLVGSFDGPADTPYAGGKFEVSIKLPDTYPFAPPQMRFSTKVYHPNVSSQNGAICLSTLKEGWTPVLSLKTTLQSLQSLLASPEPSDPQDASVANHFLTDHAGFVKQARFWTQAYAGGPGEPSGTAGESTPQDEARLAGIPWSEVDKFAGMGFEPGKVVKVLITFGDRRTSASDEEILEKLLA